MRIGIFGGTFDPIHVAHLRCAEEVREALHLDKLLFIPSAVPPHKHGRELTPAGDRLAMVRHAIRGNPAFRVSEVEIRRPGHSYSVDTLRLLHARMPPGTQFTFLLGIDQFRVIDTWKDYQMLFTLADFAVMTRPPHEIRSPRALLPVAARSQFCYADGRSTLLHRSGNRIVFLTVTALDISASAIRQRLHDGQSVRYLVPPAVERYIRSHRLYPRRSKSS